jgi:hypothetical protein
MHLIGRNCGRDQIVGGRGGILRTDSEPEKPSHINADEF